MKNKLSKLLKLSLFATKQKLHFPLKAQSSLLPSGSTGEGKRRMAPCGILFTCTYSLSVLYTWCVTLKLHLLIPHTALYSSQGFTDLSQRRLQHGQTTRGFRCTLHSTSTWVDLETDTSRCTNTHRATYTPGMQHCNSWRDQVEDRDPASGLGGSHGNKTGPDQWPLCPRRTTRGEVCVWHPKLSRWYSPPTFYHIPAKWW